MEFIVRQPAIAISILSALLLLSNAAWFYRSVDAGASYTYLDDSYRQARGAALQCFAAVKASANAGATRDSVVTAARELGMRVKPFEKDGFTWVGYAGLRFDNSGRLVEVAPSADPF